VYDDESEDQTSNLCMEMFYRSTSEKLKNDDFDLSAMQIRINNQVE
jgi:hypothetical protein